MPPSKKRAGPPASAEEVALLAARLRDALPPRGVTEQSMFGGVCFMLNGNMTICASRSGLLVRVGKDGYAAALRRPGARPMEMRGKPMAGYLFVDRDYLDEATLGEWIASALAFTRTLAPKEKAKPAKKKKGVKR